LLDLFLPSTDAGVAFQFVVWIVATIAGLYLSRRHKDVRLLIIGLSTLTLAGMAIRAVH